jgi:hypothetical protein
VRTGVTAAGGGRLVGTVMVRVAEDVGDGVRVGAGVLVAVGAAAPRLQPASTKTRANKIKMTDFFRIV